MYQFDTPTSAPPQVVWEFVTAPGRRLGWQLGVTGVEMIAKGRNSVRIYLQRGQNTMGAVAAIDQMEDTLVGDQAGPACPLAARCPRDIWTS